MDAAYVKNRHPAKAGAPAGKKAEVFRPEIPPFAGMT
jgi:hypothetical protein